MLSLIWVTRHDLTVFSLLSHSAFFECCLVDFGIWGKVFLRLVGFVCELIRFVCTIPGKPLLANGLRSRDRVYIPALVAVVRH